MTERRRMEDALRATTQLQTAILDAAAHAIIATDANGLVQTFNPAAEKLLGWRAEEIIGQKTPSLWHDMKEMTAHARELSQELEREFSPLEALMIHPALGEIETHEWTYIRKDGTRIPVALTVTALRDEDETLTGFLGISYDITERRRSENLIAAQRDELAAANERLSRLATTDALTGAFNRRSFSDTLEAEFGRSARSGEAFSLVMLDIDCFKHLNDTFGHPAGDAVLVQLAKILQETCRPADFVARYGGEEFALILPATDAVGARALCERCRIAIESAPWQHRAVTASFGAATIDALSLRNDLSMTLGERVEILIKHADDALYRAKAEGRNRVCHSDDPQNPELSTVENDRTQFSAQTGIPSLSSARETSAPKR